MRSAIFARAIILFLSACLAAPAAAQQYACIVQPDAGVEAALIPPQFLLLYRGAGSVTVTHGWIDGSTISRHVSVRTSGGAARINYSPGEITLRNGDRVRISYRLVHNRASGSFEVNVRSSDVRGRLYAIGGCRAL